jgi:hypothetical protein
MEKPLDQHRLERYSKKINSSLYILKSLERLLWLRSGIPAFNLTKLKEEEGWKICSSSSTSLLMPQ